MMIGAACEELIHSAKYNGKDQNLSFFRNVKMRCLWQWAVPPTIVVKTKRKVAIPNA